MRFYTYDPAGSGQDAFAGPYVAGQTFTRVDTGDSVVCQGAAVPEWGLYEAVEDNSACPTYYLPPTVDLAFSGTVGAADGRVAETVVCTRSPMDSLLTAKQGELSSFAAFVRVQSVRSTASPNFWIDLSQTSRDGISSATQFLFDRLKDRTLGPDSTVTPTSVNDPTTYWARDVPVLLIRNSNGNRLIAGVDEAAWGQLAKDIAVYDFATRDATVAVNNAFEAAAPTYFADGSELPAEWDALAAVDVTDASYGWPAYYTGTQSVGIRVL